MKNIYSIFFITLVVFLMSSCDKDPNSTGTEYAPQMYVSKPYEPYTQVKDNNINPMGLNVRQPAKGSISRRWTNKNQQDRYESKRNGSGKEDIMYYDIPSGAEGLAYASANLKNPLKPTAAIIKEGKATYITYCSHCHGKNGDGKGPVSKKYKGVANIKAKSTLTHGHIFHVITHGKGLMWPHGSQVKPEDRWKLVHYIKTKMHGEKPVVEEEKASEVEEEDLLSTEAKKEVKKDTTATH